MKTIELIKTQNGIDLIIERDAGNPIRILMGTKKSLINNWERLKNICEDAIDEINQGA